MTSPWINGSTTALQSSDADITLNYLWGGVHRNHVLFHLCAGEANPLIQGGGLLTEGHRRDGFHLHFIAFTGGNLSETGLEAENTPTQRQADKAVSLRGFDPVRLNTRLQPRIRLPGHAIPAVFNTSASERSVAKGCLCPSMVAEGQRTYPEEEARP